MMTACGRSLKNTYLSDPVISRDFSCGRCIPMIASVFAMIPILLLPIVPIMFITAAIAVRSYRLTGNIYIAAIVNTLLIVMITVATTSFSFPY